MLKNIHIENFKCFENQKFELNRLNILCGINASGKSSLIQALLLLRQQLKSKLDSRTSTKPDYLNGAWLQAGSIKDVLYRNASTENIKFKVDLTETERPLVWHFENINNQLIMREDPLTDFIKLADPERNAFFGSIISSNLYSNHFSYINAERWGPRVTLPYSFNPYNSEYDVGPHGEYMAGVLENSQEQRLEKDDPRYHINAPTLTLFGQIEAWLTEITPGVQINFSSLKEVDQANLRFGFRRSGDVPEDYRATMVGFGLSYSLPIIIGLLAAKKGSLLILENPEAHLHPKGQTKLGILLTRAAEAGVQIVCETHSDHLINGIRLEVKRRKENSDLIRIHYLERSSNQEVKSTLIKCREDGSLTDWPAGFFDESINSLSLLMTS